MLRELYARMPHESVKPLGTNTMRILGLSLWWLGAATNAPVEVAYYSLGAFNVGKGVASLAFAQGMLDRVAGIEVRVNGEFSEQYQRFIDHIESERAENPEKCWDTAEFHNSFFPKTPEDYLMSE